MAKYFALLERRVDVVYRAADLFLPATGRLVADSGRSIFLEEHFRQHGSMKTFRWEIPYQCIVRLGESVTPPETPERVSSPSATEGATHAGLLPLKNRPREA